MNSKKQWAPCSAVTVGQVIHTESGAWCVSGTLAPKGICPDCGLQSRQRHGWGHRRLQDFPAHGNAVTVNLRVGRWRCSGPACPRGTFSDQETSLARSFARWSCPTSVGARAPLNTPLLSPLHRPSLLGELRVESLTCSPAHPWGIGPCTAYRLESLSKTGNRARSSCNHVRRGALEDLAVLSGKPLTRERKTFTRLLHAPTGSCHHSSSLGKHDARRPRRPHRRRGGAHGLHPILTLGSS